MNSQLIIGNQIDSLFLIFLSIMGGFGYRLLTCPLQDKLSNHPIFRQIAFFVVILFTTSFLDDGKTNPLVHLKNATIVYIFFTLFTKSTLRYTIIIFFLLLIIYISHTYQKYFQYKIDQKDSNSLSYQNYINILNNLNNFLIIISIIFLLIGFYNYIIKKQKQYGKKFNFTKFFIGSRNCMNFNSN